MVPIGAFRAAYRAGRSPISGPLRSNGGLISTSVLPRNQHVWTMSSPAHTVHVSVVSRIGNSIVNSLFGESASNRR